MIEWTDSLWKRKVNKPVFKTFFYWSRTSPVEHRRICRRKNPVGYKRICKKIKVIK